MRKINYLGFVVLFIQTTLCYIRQSCVNSLITTGPRGSYNSNDPVERHCAPACKMHSACVNGVQNTELTCSTAVLDCKCIQLNHDPIWHFTGCVCVFKDFQKHSTTVLQRTCNTCLYTATWGTSIGKLYSRTQNQHTWSKNVTELPLWKLVCFHCPKHWVLIVNQLVKLPNYKDECLFLKKF